MTQAAITTLFDLFGANLGRNDHKPFLVDADRTATYVEVDHLVRVTAADLLERGVCPGDRVIVQLRKGIPEVVAMLAVARIGAAIVNVGIAWTAEQMRFVAADCEARVLICEPRMIRELEQSGIAADRLMVPPGSQDRSRPEFTTPPARRQAADLAAIAYTSGSTGKPKGVMLSHANLLAGARSVCEYLNLGPGDRLLSVLPYCFDYGLNQLTTMMLVGGTIVHQPIAMATEIVSALRAHEITGFAAVPPLWIQIVRLLEAAPVALPALRYVTNSGGKIPLGTLQRMPEVLPGVKIFLMYGLTEAFRSTYLAPERFAAKMGAIGQAVPGAEVFVIRPEGGLAEPGESGELVHRGPLVSQGYWNRPEDNARKFRPCPELRHLIGDEPVVYSGDTVRIDADGDLWFVGRQDGMIKTSGYRVSPEDVEDLAYRSGIARDVVAFGVNDDLLGQSIHIAATLLSGGTRDALLAHCRKVMPAYMVPRQIHIWPDPLPRTASGKLSRPDVIRACGPAAETRL